MKELAATQSFRIPDGDVKASSLLASTEQESDWSKISREVNLLTDGIASGITDGAQEAAHDLPGTVGRVGAAAMIGLALASAGRVGGLPMLCAKAIGGGMAVSFALDVLSPSRWNSVATAVSDTWNNTGNPEEDKARIEANLGRFAFDTVLTSVVGGLTMGGLKHGLKEEGPAVQPSWQSPKSWLVEGSLASTVPTQFTPMRRLPTLEVFPEERLEAPKHARLLQPGVNATDKVVWPYQGRELEWQPSPETVRARLEAQTFVKQFMSRDFQGALGTALSTPSLQNVEINPSRRTHAVSIAAEDLSDPYKLQLHMDSLSTLARFEWRQVNTEIEFGPIKYEATLPTTMIRLRSNNTVPLFDFQKSDIGGYSLDFPMKTKYGQSLTNEEVQEITAIRNSQPAKRLMAESALFAFEETLVHANQEIVAQGRVISPTYAAFLKSFGEEHQTRPSLLKFIGMLDSKHPFREPSFEQEVPALLYDAGMPLPMIERHYFYGQHHVPERSLVMQFLKDNESM